MANTPDPTNEQMSYAEQWALLQLKRDALRTGGIRALIAFTQANAAPPNTSGAANNPDQPMLPNMQMMDFATLKRVAGGTAAFPFKSGPGSKSTLPNNPNQPNQKKAI